MSTEFETEGARVAEPAAASASEAVPVQRNRALFALYVLALATAALSPLFYLVSSFYEVEYDENGTLINVTDAASAAMFQGIATNLFLIAILFLALGLAAHAINWQIQTSSRK